MIHFSILEKAAHIKLLILDVDGVLTDRKIYFSDSGGEYKAFNSLDGFGIKMLQSTGVQVGIITARFSSIVKRRMDELGVSQVYQGQQDKRQAFHEMMETLNLTAQQVAYLGDDLPDLPLILQSGLGMAVADAAPYVRLHADYLTQAAGGQGAVREVCELIMQAQGTLAQVCDQYTHRSSPHSSKKPVS